MTELQHGILQWLALAAAFWLGWGFRGLFASGQRRESLIADAERIGRWQRERDESTQPRDGRG
jgi:hypothetical protein